MQPGSLPARSLAACTALSFAASLLSHASQALGQHFEAFSWANQHPASTERVHPLVQVSPWSDLADVAQQLKALPEGKRFVVFFHVAEPLADHPSDRCRQVTWQTRTRTLPAAEHSGKPTAAASRAPSAAASVRSAVPMASQVGRTAVSQRSAAPPKAIAVTERVRVETLTNFRGPWMDNGIAVVRERVDAIVRRLKALGAPVDGFTLSNETTLHAASFVGVPGCLAAIESDPRWPALADALRLPRSITGMNWGTPLYFMWTERMSGRFDAAMNAAVRDPILRAYPGAAICNYATGRMAAPFASPDINGHLDRRETVGFGTHDNADFYAWLAPGRIARARGDASVDEGWVAFRAEMHKLRGMMASSPRPIHAWVARRSWQGESWGRIPIASSPMWDELVLQLGMHGVQRFFELSIEDYSTSREANLAQRVVDRQALDDLLRELEHFAGGASGPVLGASQPSWNDRVLATGRRFGDRIVWRISFAEGIDSIRVALADGSEAVIEREPGRCGAWFEQDASTRRPSEGTRGLPFLEIIDADRGSRVPGTVAAAGK
jgi:hypothetical protein